MKAAVVPALGAPLRILTAPGAATPATTENGPGPMPGCCAGSTPRRPIVATASTTSSVGFPDR